MVEGTSAKADWPRDEGARAAVLDLTVEQIASPRGEAAAEVLSLGAEMEVREPASRRASSSDPIVRIRNGQRRAVGDRAKPPEGPPPLPRMVSAEWNVVLSGSVVALDSALRVAREHAHFASRSQERTKAVLYRAISSAYDLALVAREAPDSLAELLEISGITALPRAPMTPIVKLVFGTDYDKTRLAEYAAVLTHAARHGVQHGELEGLLHSAEGGIKAIVALERRGGAALPDRTAPVRGPLSKRAVHRLRKLPASDFGAIPTAGEEFALVLIRRTADHQVEVIGEVPTSPKLLQGAVKAVLT